MWWVSKFYWSMLKCFELITPPFAKLSNNPEAAKTIDYMEKSYFQLFC